MPDAEKQSWQSRCFVPIKQCALHKLRRQEMRIATGANALAMTRSGNRSCVSFQNVGAAIDRPLPQCDARQTDEQRLLLPCGQFSSCSPLRIRFKTVSKIQVLPTACILKLYTYSANNQEILLPSQLSAATDDALV